MDASINRIIQKVAAEYDLDPGFLKRIIELEEDKAHLVRRHGIFDELHSLALLAAQRELQQPRKGVK
jgi:hypothetical protein